MFSHTLIRSLNLAAVSAVVALAAFGTPTRAEDRATNLGPVGPYEPILTSVGSKRVIAFYAPDSGHCAVSAVIWDERHGPTTSTRVRTNLGSGEVMHVEAVGNSWIDFRCGDNAETLAVVDTGGPVALGPVLGAGR